MDQNTLLNGVAILLGSGGLGGAIGVFRSITKVEDERDALAAKVHSMEVSQRALETRMNQLDPERLARVDVRIADLSSQVAQQERFAREDKRERDRQVDKVMEALGAVGEAVQQIKSQKRATQ